MKEELKKKAKFVNDLCDLLRTDPRSSVDLIHYEVRIEGGYTDEIVHICYEGGHRTKLLVTADSKGAILKAIANEVYR